MKTLLFFILGISVAFAQGSGIQGSLAGTWKSVCMNLDAQTSIIITMTLDGAGGSKSKTDFYSDPLEAAPDIAPHLRVVVNDEDREFVDRFLDVFAIHARRVVQVGGRVVTATSHTLSCTSQRAENDTF